MAHGTQTTYTQYVIVRRLTPLQRLSDYVISYVTAGTETRRVHRARGAGAEPAMDTLLATAEIVN